MLVKIKENSWLARVAAIKLRCESVAIVFGSTIHLYNTSAKDFLANQNWVLHELKHVEQYKRFGKIGFVCRYLGDWIKNGYYNNKFEKEARESERDLGLLKKARFV